MKKKIILLGFALVLVTGTFAQKFTIDLGGIFTHTAAYDWGTAPYKQYWSSSKGRIGGGFDFQFRYKFFKELAVYTLLDVAFPARHDVLIYGNYLIDWQLGLGWRFNLAKNFDFFVGGGLAVGGTEDKTKSTNTTVSMTNVGFGVNGVFSYMFIKNVGIYFGFSDNIYAPVNKKTKVGETVTQKKPTERLTNSLNLKLGLQLEF